jgi:hypothetical protein
MVNEALTQELIDMTNQDRRLQPGAPTDGRARPTGSASCPAGRAYRWTTSTASAVTSATQQQAGETIVTSALPLL